MLIYMNAILFVVFIFFFFNDTATTEIYTLSLHDALPIRGQIGQQAPGRIHHPGNPHPPVDRKSTRLNSSHGYNSYAVFCLKKKKIIRERVSVLSNEQQKLAILDGDDDL